MYGDDKQQVDCLNRNLCSPRIAFRATAHLFCGVQDNCPRWAEAGGLFFHLTEYQLYALARNIFQSKQLFQEMTIGKIHYFREKEQFKLIQNNRVAKGVQLFQKHWDTIGWLLGG